MNQWQEDLIFAQESQKKLKEFYATKAYEGRYVFIKNPLSDRQEN